MYSGKDAANTAYPTQWALNPTAYQNIDSSQVDWAALAQQWIAMKEAAAIVAVPPAPPAKPEEEGEAPMEVENPDTNSDGPIPPGAEWNSSTNSWGGWNNQWGWAWSGSGPTDSKITPDSALGISPLLEGYVPPEGAASMPGYTTGTPAPTFQHGYWTAPQAEQANSRSSSLSRDRRSKSKNREHKPRNSRSQREKAPVIPAVIEPLVMPTAIPSATIDAAKRRQLPAWIREGLEKMEREKQKAIEREQEKRAREVAEKEKKRLEEEELERMKAEASGQPVLPPKSKFESDSEGEEGQEEEKENTTLSSPVKQEQEEESIKVKQEREELPPLVKRSKEEIMQEVMLAVRRSLTEILLEVTDQEIQTVSQEELARYTALQASRLNAMKASKSKALAAIASGLGLGAYESSSDESGDEDEQNDLSDHQLQEIIKRKRLDFERTSREIEAEVRRAEARENEEQPMTPTHATPERPNRSRSSATPPPVESETPTKVPARRISKDRRNSYKTVDKVDGVRKLESISEEKTRKSNKRHHTPSPNLKSSKTNNKESSTTSSDSEEDSSSSSSERSSETDPEIESETKAKKRRRRNSSSSGSRKKSKRVKHKKEKSSRADEKRYSKSKYYDEYERSEKSRSKRKDDHYDKHKSSKSRDYDRHKDRYRESSEELRTRSSSRRPRRDRHDRHDRLPLPQMETTIEPRIICKY
ncbi:unnamed protein product [Arctia plantaginis]|uniref:Arginine/serine-rich protein PNISR n=1 Tax=Arctia plantaginis TaxID=874455 RepID=A0A8S1B6M4_ARCPL|nr:unnamed protein product [Arctia plantaginis]